MGKLRWRIYNLIRDDDENDTASNIFDGTIVSLIVRWGFLMEEEIKMAANVILRVTSHVCDLEKSLFFYTNLYDQIIYMMRKSVIEN